MRIGVDLGGTKIEAIALDQSGAETARQRVLAPRGDYEETLRAIRDLVRSVVSRSGNGVEYSVGIGIPGTISRTTGRVKNANSTWLNGRPLERDLAECLGREVRIANDANCFSVSEATDGAGVGAEVLFGVILGTGVGGGIAIQQRALIGDNGIAGEWGHNELPWREGDERPGEPCYCGRRGCIETFLSGPALCRESGRFDRVEELAAAAEDGDVEAERLLQRYEHRLARGLASVINVLDPSVIVLGGGLSNLERLYENVPRLWHSWIFSDDVQTRLRRNVHGDSSGVRGAAWLW